LAAQATASQFVSAGKCHSFPLLYHWCVLPGAIAREQSAAVQEELERMSSYWRGEQAVARRLQAIQNSTSYVALFIEYIPQNLHQWLSAQLANGSQSALAACLRVEQLLKSDLQFMSMNGLFHFDLHLRNILTDGESLYFADYGLALATQFHLSDGELAFLKLNTSHDAAYNMTQLHNWMVANLPDAEALPLVKHYAPVAALVNDFYRHLRSGNFDFDYPAAKLDFLCAAKGLSHGP